MATSTIQQTIEQKRAASAYHDVVSIKFTNCAKDYKNLAKSAPADIQTNGLGQTVAFWRAKGKGEHAKLYEHLSKWLSEPNKNGMTNGTELQKWIIAADTSSADYRRATVEALAYLSWLKRFSEAEIETKRAEGPTDELSHPA
jgi:CRISPR-associated protein Cmr5